MVLVYNRYIRQKYYDRKMHKNDKLTENISLTSHPLALLSKSRFISTSPFVAPLSNSNDHGSSSFSSNREPLHREMAVSVWKVSFVAFL